MKTVNTSKTRQTALWVGGVGIALAAVGCATGPPKSGFLSDYSGLEMVADDAPIWGAVDPDAFGRERLNVKLWADKRNLARLGDYDRVMIDPMVVQFKPDAEGAWVSPQRLHEITQYAYDAMKSALEDRYPVVVEPGEGVLRIRRALTDVQPMYVYPPTSERPAPRWANSYPGSVSFEGEVVDSLTGERVLALLGTARGNTFDALQGKDIWEHAKRGVAGSAGFLREHMDEAHAAD